MIGQTVFHYRILEKLGEGGMGVVYKAEDLKLTRTVALKFLPRGLDAHQPERERFLQEARAAATLNHPNICTVHDIQEQEGQQFIVMEYVEGKTLREIIPVKKMQDAITYAIQIAEGLQEAHTHGIVHRDIKAENIMVNSKNQVKVMDFGLAKLKGSLKLTKTSSTIGTLAYMAPEQIQGEEVDARSDIFSFGIVLYEMLTGHLPFKGEHEAAMVYSIVNEPPASLQHYVPDAPAELLHILDRALEKDREDRYQIVHEMLVDLRRLKKDSTRVLRQGHYDTTMPVISTQGPAVGRRKLWRIRVLRSAAGLIAVCVIAALLLILLKPPFRLNPNRTSVTLRIPAKEVGYPSLSRDGNWLAFKARDENGKSHVYTMNVAGEKANRVTFESATNIDVGDISPDISQIVYACQIDLNTIWKVKLVAFQGGESRTVADTGTAPKWRPDGQRIGYMRGTRGMCPSVSGNLEIWTVKPDGTDKCLELIDTASRLGAANAFCWSPDGGSIAWVRNYPEGYGEAMVRELSTGKERQLTSDKKTVDEVIWTTNDAILFVSNKSGQTNLWVTHAGGGDAIQITQGGVPIGGARISADNKTLVYMQKEDIAHIWISSIDGSNARQVTSADALVQDPSFSPDAKHIAYITAGDVDFFNRSTHLYIIDRDGKNERQLTSGLTRVTAARWSPDGKWIAYISGAVGEPGDSGRVFLIQPSSPGVPRQLCSAGSMWWPDSQSVVVGRQLKLLRYPIKGGVPTPWFQDSIVARPIQGEKLLFYRDYRIGREGRWVVSLDAMGAPSGEPKRIPPPTNIRVLGANGWRTLIYEKRTGEIWRTWTTSGKEERIGKVIPGDVWMGDVSTDGKEIVWLRNSLRSKLVLVKNVFE